MASRGEAISSGRPVHQNAAADSRIRAKNEARQFRATRPHETRYAENLSAAQPERTAMDTAPVRHVLDFKERRLTTTRAGSRFALVEAGKTASDHHSDEAFVRKIRASNGADDRPVPQNGDAIGKTSDLGHPVADIDNREAAVA